MYTRDTFCKITDPPLKCPFHKGSYVGNKQLFDFSPVDLLPFDAKYKWILIIDLYEKGLETKNQEKLLPLGCWLMQISRTKVINRKRSGKGK